MPSSLLLLGLLLLQEPASVARQPAPLATPKATGRVARQDAPSNLRAEARALIRDERSSAGSLVELAGRAFQAGSGREALELVDAALRREPDHAGALAWLLERRERIALDLPLPPAPAVWELDDERLVAAIDASFAPAAAWPPSPRELAVARLADAAHPEAVRAAATRNLLSRDSRRRSFAALVLRRLFPGQEANGLIERSLLDPDEEVRMHAAVGLAQMADPAVAAPAVRALDAGRPVLRLHAAQALGWMGYTEAVPPLAEALFSPAPAATSGARSPRAFAFFGTQRAYLQDFDVEVATGQSIADPKIGVLATGAVLDVRVLGTTSSPARFERSAMTALRRLTGEDPGRGERAWRAWWADSDHNPLNAERRSSSPISGPAGG